MNLVEGKLAIRPITGVISITEGGHQSASDWPKMGQILFKSQDLSHLSEPKFTENGL